MAEEQDRHGSEGGDQDEAARAFDNLRAEISVQRRAIEALFDQLESSRPPDYAPTLGVISERIGEVEERLASYEEHPALKLTPEQHGRAVANAGARLLHDAAQVFDREARETERERHQLARMIGTVRDRHQQRRALAWTAATSLVAGLVLFPVIAAFGPGGTYLAALAAGNINRWAAGSDLMYAADPEGARNLVYTSIMLEENAEAIRACRDVAQKAGTAQKCEVSVPAP